MATSVRTKVRKKQHPFAPALPKEGHEDAVFARKLEQAALELEDMVFHVLNADKGDVFHDVDFLYWTRKLKNIATQVSLALAEYRGPRRFHYHYRHDPSNYDTLYPVSGPTALETLMRVCREGLSACAEMVGIQDEQVLFERNRLEQAIRVFLSRCLQGNGNTNGTRN